jgi:hypothetical protein
MDDRDLLELLVQARARNLRNGVTGMLLYKNRRFMQLLEGDEEKVLKIFDNIKRDERHRNVDTLWRQYVQFRDFPDWTMGFQNVDQIDVSSLPGYTSFLDQDLRYEDFCENSTEVHTMLQAFRDTASY